MSKKDEAPAVRVSGAVRSGPVAELTIVATCMAPTAETIDAIGAQTVIESLREPIAKDPEITRSCDLQREFHEAGRQQQLLAARQQELQGRRKREELAGAPVGLAGRLEALDKELAEAEAERVRHGQTAARLEPVLEGAMRRGTAVADRLVEAAVADRHRQIIARIEELAAVVAKQAGPELVELAALSLATHQTGSGDMRRVELLVKVKSAFNNGHIVPV
jgi:hypothetical protein